MADFGHVGLTVADLDRSLDFYRRVVGLEEIHRTVFVSEAFGMLTRNPGARIETAMLREGDFVLQLVAYDEGGGDVLELEHRNVGNPHLSFWVPDVRARFAELSADASVEVISELVEIAPGITSFYVADPDGVPVELAQQSAPASD
jgi:catechol 2,3-dioxygenase-like lactoylglutathione lyase family enzyme